MQIDAREQQQIREYLLGRLPSEQQSELEERLLSDDDLYEEIQIVEDELVDEYLRNELSQTDRTSFEAHFLASSEHQAKTQFARNLTRYVAARAEAVGSVTENSNRKIARGRTWRRLGFLPTQNPILGYALATAVLLIVVGVGWWAVKNWIPGSRRPGKVLSCALTPGLTRGRSEETTQVLIAPDVDTVRLQMLLPDNAYESYEASLLDSDSQTITSQTDLKPQFVNNERVVILDIDSARLPAGDYRIKLSDATANGKSPPLATYAFQVKNP